MNEQTKIKIFLKNGFCYTGEKLSDENGFVKIKDIKGKYLEINKTDISVIEELI